MVRGFLPERSGKQRIFLPGRGDPNQVKSPPDPRSSFLPVQGVGLEEQQSGTKVSQG